MKNKLGQIMSDNKVIQDLMEHKFFENNLDNLNVFIKYTIARIDIKNYGSSENNLIILESSDENSKIENPDWFKTKEGTGWMIHSKKGIIDLKIKCINEGQLKIFIRGLEYVGKNDHKTVIDVNFTKLIVNGTCVFDSQLNDFQLIKSYYYTLEKVKNNEIVDIHIEWDPF